MLQVTLMLIVMAINAQQFPVATIRGIVVVVMVAMMYREFGKVGACEFPLASTANPGVHFQGLFPVTFLPLILLTPGIGNDLIQFVLLVAHCI